MRPDKYCGGHFATGLLLMVVVATAGCDASSGYRGDGILYDAGVAAGHQRYIVDLGAIDLSSPNHRTFRMAGLPTAEFTAGMRPIDVSGGCSADAASEVEVRLSIRTGEGALVVDEAGPIKAWIASSGLLYRRGTERQEPRPDGSVERMQTGARASGGWGTYFTPTSGTTYVVDFKVTRALGSGHCESSLVLLGGGWK